MSTVRAQLEVKQLSGLPGSNQRLKVWPVLPKSSCLFTLFRKGLFIKLNLDSAKCVVRLHIISGHAKDKKKNIFLWR